MRSVLSGSCAAVVALILIHPALAQSAPAPAPRPKLVASEAKRLLAEAFSGDAKRSEPAREKLRQTAPEDRKPLFDLLLSLPWKPPAGRKASAEKDIRDVIDVPESPLKRAPFIIELPKDYDGRKPVPALFRFHGSGDTASAFAKNCNHDPAFAKFLLITPEIPSEKREGWNEPGTRGMVDRLWRQVIANYCVDPDRVWLSGYSAGGAAAFFFAQNWPHRTAGFYAMGRLHWNFHLLPEPCMDILRYVPGFFAVGLQDTDERVQGYRLAEAYYQKTKLPGVFNYVKGRGHEYLAEFNRPAMEYLSKTTRKKYPKEFAAIFFKYRGAEDEVPLTSRIYWLEGRTFSPNGTPVRVKVEGNVIEITGPELTAGRVYVNDQIVNLDQPVIVTLNGREVANGVVERSVPFLLDWWDKNLDRGDVYWNQIDFGS